MNNLKETNKNKGDSRIRNRRLKNYENEEETEINHCSSQIQLDNDKANLINRKSSNYEIRSNKSAGKFKGSNMYTSGGLSINNQTSISLCRELTDEEMKHMEKKIQSFAERKTTDSKRLADFMPASISSYCETKSTNLNYNSNNAFKEEGNSSVNNYIKSRVLEVDNRSKLNCPKTQIILDLNHSNSYDPKLCNNYLADNSKVFSNKLINPSTEKDQSPCAKSDKQFEKENIIIDEIKIINDNILKGEDNLIINDISGYATKSRRNLVDNNSKIIQNNSTFLQDMNTEDDLLCNTETNEDPHSKSEKCNSIIERTISTKSQGKPPSHPQKSVACCTSKCTNYDGKEKYERTKLSKSPDMRPKWKGFGACQSKSLADNKLVLNSDSKTNNSNAKVNDELKYKVKRLGSEKRSPKVNSNSKQRSVNEPIKSGHSQTVDCLRQNLKSKSDEVNVLKGKITSLSNTITNQNSLIKMYESISIKLK